MSRLRSHDPVRDNPVPRAPKKVRPADTYLVRRRQDCWFIEFEEAEYGPYQTADEAMLFAINASQKLGEHGRKTAVQKLDGKGKPTQAWTFGDAYPPVL